MEAAVADAEREFGIEPGRTLIMAALESARGVMNAYEVCQASPRLFGIALSGGDYTKDLQTTISGTGVELMGARQHMIIAARAAGVQCVDTVYTNLDDMDGFRRDVETIHAMGFDGKSIINPRQIPIVHDVYTPRQKDIIFAEKVVREIESKQAQGIGVFTVDGKMIDIAFYAGAKRTLALARALSRLRLPSRRGCDSPEARLGTFFGVITTRRLGSSPSEWVSTSGLDCSVACSTRRS